MNVSARFAIIACAAVFGAGASLAQERTGEQIVGAQCSKCHQAGVNGAPRIDDRAAWIPRMKNGLNATVRSASKGHGNMPARGGLADLSDTELRNAILYMFYPAGEAQSKLPAPAPAAPPDPHRKTVAGMEVYLGVVAAGAAGVKQSTPQGSGYYYVNISLRDSKTGAPIKDAQVEARAANAVGGGETRKLEANTTGDAPGFGNFFRMQGTEPYAIAVHIRRPGVATAAEAKFEFKP